MENLLVNAVADLNENIVIKIVTDLLSKGEEVSEIHNQLSRGLQLVGERYEKGEYYIADLIVAGELIKNIMKIKGMAFSKKVKGPSIGTIIVGTVFEDIHDVGKDIFISMLQSSGFRTIDLGVDVSSEKFIEAIRSENPDIVGISGVLSMIGDNIKKVIDDITAAGLRDDVFIIVGGAVSNEKLFKVLSADAFSQDAAEGVRICLEWMKSKR
ncbi:MAG: cobalamin B12-binding domain-containing protein [Eubacteriaceae bacterium]